MYLSVRLLAVAVCLAPFLSFSAPSLQNVNVSFGDENTIFVLSANIDSGGGGNMTLWINWGDATPLDAYSISNSATSFSVSYLYDYSQDLGTGSNLYPVSVTLSNNTGMVATNLTIVVTNAPPRLMLNVNSPIEVDAPAALRGLEITEFAVPSRGSSPHGITVGPDGNLWFTESGSNRVGRITTNGVVTEFPIGAGARTPLGIGTGSDNRLWFCAANSGQIGAMTTNGVVTLYTIPRQANEPLKVPQYIIRGGGANMWYTDLSYRIGRITPAGVITQFVHAIGVNPWGLALGADNNIWFTAFYSDSVHRFRQTDAVTTTYPLESFSSPALMTRGPDGQVWFTENQSGMIGRVNTNGVITEAFTGFHGPYGICTGPDGAIWFTEHRRRTNSIVRLTVDGQLSRHSLAIDSDVTEIVAGPDGALWFTLGGHDRIGRIRYTSAGNVVLGGELNHPGHLDGGYLDPHTVQINWGDGSPVQTVNLAAGIVSFRVPHTYSGSQAAYPINVSIVDDDNGASTASTTVMVNAIELTSITRSVAGEVRLKGKGAAGRTIMIQGSPDLQNWSNLGTVNSTTNGFEFVQPGSQPAKQFYRGRL